MMRVLVTGANGFVGRAVCARLHSQGFSVRPVVRSAAEFFGENGAIAQGSIDGRSNWMEALKGVHTVIHLAARVHVLRERESDPLQAFRRVNLQGTSRLARQAAEMGVRRLIYMSSIKVNGEQTWGQPFNANDLPHPQDPYAQSKLEAEQALRVISAETGLETVIVRPPLVYGPGVKGNMRRLLRLVERGLPLPFALIDNQRSLVGLGNLTDFVRVCVQHPAAAGETFLVADGQDLSTPHLIRKLAAALGRQPRLWALPVPLLRFAGRLLGRQAVIERLCGSLQVDIEKNRRLLGWTPVYSVEQGLAQMVDGSG